MSSKSAYAKRTALVVVLLLIVAACGGSSGETGTTTTGAPSATSTTADTGSETTTSTVAEFDLEAYFGSHPITMVINTSEGGGTDAAGRFVASSMGQFLPGQPSIEVTNITRGPALTTIYSAPDNRLVIGFISRADTAIGLQTSPESAYDLREMPVLGAFAANPRGWYVDTSQVPEYEDITDAIGADGPVLRLPGTVAGATEVADSMMLTSWMCARLDMPCEMLNVSDDGSEQVTLMFERGEANMSESTISGIWRVNQGDLQAGTWRFLARFGPEIDEEQFPGMFYPPDINDVIEERITDPAILDEWLLISGATGMYGKFMLTGPNVPEEVVESLRQAFLDMLADPVIKENLLRISTEYEETTPADEATTLLREETQRFLDNEDLVGVLQEEFWELYWAN
jgi:hypothetical protein